MSSAVGCLRDGDRARLRASVGVGASSTAAPRHRPQPPPPAPLILTPTLAVFEEYNDNIFLDNVNRRSDWLTGISPGLALAVERETYRLTAGYSFTAEVYARETSLNETFDRQNFSLDGSYRVDPRLTLTLTDSFIASANANLVSTSGVATGRSRAWSNTVTPRAAWQVTPVTTLRLFGTYVAQRFERKDLDDSDVYRVNGVIERRLTSRLSGTAGYDFGYLDVERQGLATTHTPRLAGVYRRR